MNRDDIIRMAQEAGDDWDSTLPQDKAFLERFAALVAAASKPETAIAEAYRCGYEAGAFAARDACIGLKPVAGMRSNGRKRGRND